MKNLIAFVRVSLWHNTGWEPASHHQTNKHVPHSWCLKSRLSQAQQASQLQLLIRRKLRNILPQNDLVCDRCIHNVRRPRRANIVRIENACAVCLCTLLLKQHVKKHRTLEGATHKAVIIALIYGQAKPPSEFAANVNASSRDRCFNQMRHNSPTVSIEGITFSDMTCCWQGAMQEVIYSNNYHSMPSISGEPTITAVFYEVLFKTCKLDPIGRLFGTAAQYLGCTSCIVTSSSSTLSELSSTNPTYRSEHKHMLLLV